MMLKKMLATAGTAVVLAAGSTGLAAPAQAAGPVVTGGLVNVTIVDAIDVNDVVVQLPIAAAINVCDVADVNVAALALAAQNIPSTATCTATADSRANNR